ncbi:hypothetical protein [Pseudonocardia humida]|uniref:Uncharacterized protein n=1 Tax=Pseudonocardia humida TaxID=2800819 RepID=A0ABT0ZV48_9PSEU|nr:hypothetical protein [Pseudonocardia humida]MCO1654609.1 hypothetical protein [Pseudonocardia humida]
MEIDAARDRFTAASRAAQDQLLDVLNAQRDGHPDAVRAAVVDLVEAQRATVEAHQQLVDAAGRYEIDPEVRARLEAEHAQLRHHLAATEHELDRLTVRPGHAPDPAPQVIDLSIPLVASADDMALVADRLQRAAHIADRAGAPLLVGPLLDVAHLLRRVADEGGTEPSTHAAADLAAALLGYQDHLPMP